MMGFRLRRSIKIAPGIKINLSKSGVSASIGPKGAKVTVGPHGTRKTVGLPGTGLSYTSINKSSIATDSKGCSYIKECPYCGRKMRKRWDCCPECGEELPQPDGSNENLLTNKKAASASGCLLPILLLIAICFLAL